MSEDLDAVAKYYHNILDNDIDKTVFVTLTTLPDIASKKLIEI